MKKAIPIVVAMLIFSNALGQQAQKKTATAPRAAAPKASLLNPASLKDQAPAVFKAQFTTTQGDFVIEVTRAFAPRGADRFYNLVKYHFYDGAAFFRVIPEF